MSTARESVEFNDYAEFFEALGGIPWRRVKFRPPPGTATEADLIRLNERKEGLYELIDGALVEKGMGYSEDGVGVELIFLLTQFVRAHDLGHVGGAQASMRLGKGIVRLPDVHFIPWDRLPGRRLPVEATPELYPDLAVEVLSEGNTAEEMERKRKEYFFAGTRLVWEVDPRRREIDVYTDPETRATLTEADVLDGGAVLPGFSVSVAEVFARVPRKPAGRKKKRG